MSRMGATMSTWCAGCFTAPVEAHNVLALRITPVEEGAEENERWRPWHQYGSTSQRQPASSLRVKERPYLHMQLQSLLRRFGLCR